MQITNSVVCDQVNVGLYKQIKPPLVGEHAFPLTGFLCKEAHVTHVPCTAAMPPGMNYIYPPWMYYMAG